MCVWKVTLGPWKPHVFQQRWAEVWSVSGEDPENDSDFSGSEDDESFTVRKSKVKETKRKEVKAKPPAEKKEKPKPKRGAGGKPVPHTSFTPHTGLLSLECFPTSALSLPNLWGVPFSSQPGEDGRPP